MIANSSKQPALEVVENLLSLLLHEIMQRNCIQMQILFLKSFLVHVGYMNVVQLTSITI